MGFNAEISTQNLLLAITCTQSTVTLGYFHALSQNSSVFRKMLNTKSNKMQEYINHIIHKGNILLLP